MKKVLIFAALLLISSINISIDSNFAEAQVTQTHTQVQSETKYVDGMTYRIFRYREDIEVVNITKEKLEVEKLRLEIIKLKRETR